MARITIDPLTLKVRETPAPVALAPVARLREALAEARAGLALVALDSASREARQAPQVAPRTPAPYSAPGGERTYLRPMALDSARPAPRVRVQARPQAPQVALAPVAPLTWRTALRVALWPVAAVLRFYGHVARIGLAILGEAPRR